MKLKIQRAILYCLLLSLISYGFNYHIGKLLIHLATLLSIANIIMAIKNRSLTNISADKPIVIMTSLLIISSVVTLTYHITLNNPISDRHFTNIFYPTLLFSIIFPSLSIKKHESEIITYTAIASCFVMAGSGIVDYVSNGNPGHRTSGFLNMPIIYASCMVMLNSWVSAVFFKYLLSRNWIIAAVCFLAVCTGFSAVLFTASRGPIIANVIVIIVLFIHYLFSLPSNRKKLSSIITTTSLLIIIILLIPKSLLVDNIKNRFQHGINNVSTGFEGQKRQPTSTGIRLDMWEASLVTIMDFPLTGIGSGNHVDYFHVLDKEKRININTDIIIKFDHMHNDFIQAWLSMGVIFGTIAFLFIIYLSLLFFSQINNKNFSITGFAVCLCFLLCGLTDVPAHNAASLSLFLLIMCLHLLMLSNNSNSKSHENRLC
jgi:O-antigen ligase